MPLHDHYILVGQETKTVGLYEWAEWMETGDRHVKDTWQGDDMRVSTVFLGLDHNFSDRGPPILFETMVFRNGAGDECVRYSCWDDAIAGHDAMVRRVFRAVQPTNWLEGLPEEET